MPAITATKTCKCTKCKKDKNIIHFIKNKKILKTCKLCRDKKIQWKIKNAQELQQCKEEGKTIQELREEKKKTFDHPGKIKHKFIDDVEHKRCYKCKEWKTLDCFNNSSATWDKLRADCKGCCNVYRKSIEDKLNEVVECEICSKKIKVRSLYDHNKNCHSDPNTLYKWECTDCHIKFKFKKLLNKHLKTETHVKLVKYKAIDLIELEKEIKKERKKLSNPKNKITCSFCKTVMTEKNYKERHLQLCMINRILNEFPGASKWERFVSKFCIENKIHFEMQKKYQDLKIKNCLPYDFYLKKYKLLIEVHGEFHYTLSSYKNAEQIYERNQKVDKLKFEYAKNKNIKLLIIDTRKYNTMEKINTFLTKKLSL